MENYSGGPKRVLHVIGAMNHGGAEALIMNIYRSIDRNKIQFDFLVHTAEQGVFDEEIERLGGRIFHVPSWKGLNLFAYRRAVKSFFQQHNNYVAVHGHIGSCAAIYLSVAKSFGLFTIAHSHAQNFPISVGEVLFRIASYPTRFIADYFIGCSNEAGIDRYGKGFLTKENASVLKNGVDTDKYLYSSERRSGIRKKLGIPAEATVLIHVGRLTPIKNHAFLFRVFKEFNRRCPNSFLLLVGDGEIRQQLNELCLGMGIGENVIFAGPVNNVQDYLSSADCMVFPSLKEGLPLSLIEAQASGLPCVVSSGVSKEACITQNYSILSLDEPVEIWANEIENLLLCNIERSLAGNRVREVGFDILDTCATVSELYLKEE